MFIKVLILSFVSYLLISCSTSPEPSFLKRENTQDLVQIKILDHKVPAVHLDSIFEIVRYIKPETSKKSLIGNYSKILSCNDTLFILDKSISQQSILAFNLDGEFLFKVSAQGRGPDEYLQIADFYVDPNSKHIGILNWGNVNKYDYNGKFIGQLNLRKYNIQNIEYNKNRLYAYKCPDCRTKKCFAFSAFDMDGNLIYEDYPEKKDILWFHFVKSNYLSSNSERTYINLLNSDTIYEVGEENLQPKFALDFGKFKLPDKEFKKLLNKGPDYIFDYFRKSNYPLFGLSGFSSADGYLWLSCSGYNRSSTTIYSIKSGKTKSFNSYYPSKEILLPGKIKNLNGEFFYGTIGTSEILNLKRQDEHDGILDTTKTFSQKRLDKYNFIKETKPEDNGVIVLLKTKEF